MRARILRLVILVMLVPAARAAAQSPATIAKGSRVRVDAPSVLSRPVSGTVVAFDEATLKLRSDFDQLLVVNRNAISKLDVRVARKSNWKAGALIGALAGMFAGSTVDTDCGYAFFCNKVVPIVGGGVLFAGIGAAIGALTHRETWAPVVSGARLSLAPTRKGGIVSLSIPF